MIQSRNRVTTYSAIIFAFLFLCCNSKTAKTGGQQVTVDSQESPGEYFPEEYASDIIVSDTACLRRVLTLPKLDSIHNDAKWRVYCVYYKDTVFYNNVDADRNSSSNYGLLSETNLMLGAVHQMGNVIYSGLENDYTLSFSYSFDEYYRGKDSVLRHDLQIENYNRLTRVTLVYSKERPSLPIAFVVNDNVQEVDSLHESSFCRLRYVNRVLANPFQPEIIKHVRDHADKLHPWFLAEAKKRGMFDSVKYPPKWIDRQININRRKPKDCYEERIGEPPVYVK
jgi:hypothetical protein